MSHAYLGYGLVLASSLAWAASSTVIKYTYSYGLGPIPVLIIQNIAACLVAWTWVAIRKDCAFVPPGLRLRLVCQGTIGSFFASILFYTALDQLGASLATLLLFTYPAFVTFYNSLLQRVPTTAGQRLALAMALMGILCSVDVFGMRIGGIAPLFVIIGLAAALANAFLSVNGEVLLEKMPTSAVTAYGFSFSTLTMLVVYQPWWMLGMQLTASHMGLIAVGAILSFIPIIAYLAGLKKVGSGPASIVSVAEIPLTLVMAWIFLEERMSAAQLVGGVLITASVGILYSTRTGSP